MEAELHVHVSIESCIRGHHVYKHTWTLSVGEEFSCKRESDNNKDPFAVAVIRRGFVIGHVPSCLCIETAPSTAQSLEQGAFQLIYMYLKEV